MRQKFHGDARKTGGAGSPIRSSALIKQKIYREEQVHGLLLKTGKLKKGQNARCAGLALWFEQIQSRDS